MVAASVVNCRNLPTLTVVLRPFSGKTVIFAAMRRFFQLFIPVLLALVPLAAAAQNGGGKDGAKTEDAAPDADNPAFAPMVKVSRVLVDGDSLQYVELNNVYVYPRSTFKSAKQRRAYNNLVRNVKKVLPIAKEVNKIIIETYEYLQTLPDKRARDEHMKRVEADIKRRYTPRMKKLSFSQGKLLIKLVYRECDSSAYDLIRAFISPVRAGFYQAFAWAFGASLMKKYDPEKTDRLTERVVLMVESGQI